jgi:hypothetical protein
MRRMIWVIFLALALPASALASSSVDFSNNGGTLSGNTTGLTLTGSVLTAVNHWNGGGLITGNLGSISFTTGTLATGNLQTGGTFAPGGSFTIMGSGANGVPTGIIFSGTFLGPTQWILELPALPNGLNSYTLKGNVSGTLLGSLHTSGRFYQMTDFVFNSGTGYFDGSLPMVSGDTNIVVPEPSTLILLGTGILGAAGAVRRRWIR